MQSDISLRCMAPADGPALAGLYENSPDTGQVTFSAKYNIDAYQAMVTLGGDVVGVVAETPGFDGLVGAGLVSFGQCSFEGQVRPYALLSSLAVHPAYRRRGIASQLAEWRVRHARRRFGDEGVILANIQKGNTGSQLTARKWNQQRTRRLIAVPIKVRTTPPDPMAGLSVRTIEPAEFDEVAERLNTFYEGYNLHRPHTGDSLAAWCNRTPFDAPFRHYLVATDRAGNLLAGLAVSESWRVRALSVRHMPAAMRLLNTVIRLVPADGMLRELSVDHLWFAPGQLKTARYLWETVRWEWRDRGTVLQVVFDPRSPLADVFSLRRWTPKSELSIAVRGPVPMCETRLVSPFL